MKPLKIFTFLFFASIFLLACVENDFINDLIDERISIDNPIDEIQVNDTHQLNATFFNNVGQEEQITLSWSSSNTAVATIDNQGLLTGVAEGTSTIGVSATLQDGSTVSQEKQITVTTEAVDNGGPVSKSGMIVSTSSYTLRGDFTISEIENSQDLDLQIEGNYQASTSLPGLYLYLSNNPNSISGALEVGAVQVFNGAHSYTISETAINDYKYLLYWCKPFSVKVGHGEIND